MKKILLTVAGSMFIALAAVHAQERSDTTRTDQPSSEYRTESGTQGETTTLEGKSGTQGQMSWRDEDRELVSREDLPEGLITTLEGDQYKGWESATIYRNRTSSDYMLMLNDNGEVKTFYFDSEGVAVENPDKGDDQASSGAGISGGTTTAPQTSSEVSENPSGAGVDAKSTSGDPISNTDRASGQVRYESDKDEQSSSSDKDEPSSSGVSGSVTTGDNSVSGNVSDNSVSGNVSTEKSTAVTGTEPTTPTGDGSMTVTTDADPQWPADQKVKITTSQIPSAMLITLGDPMYKGWDKSVVYKNRETNEYMMEITENGATKTYYFDGTGAARHTDHSAGQHTSEMNKQSSMDRSSGDQTSSTVTDDTSSDDTSVSGSTTTQSSTSYRTEDKSVKDEDKNDQVQTTTSGAIGPSQVGTTEEEKEPATTDSENYSLNRASTQGPVETETPTNQWKDEDRVIVESADIPASLRVTLDEDDRYDGWENSTIYQNRVSNGYMIEVRNGSESKAYYFDKDGKALEDDKD